ncbi:NAD-dependent epimerase/dehydratase family protein [Prosthecobacter sp.]|uniref:NAD-dependent epimerase/dehydratase family protein n=1 Tax=Prosthecobacter sp. TaxID=1965333 RepID=UPI003784FCF3
MIIVTGATGFIGRVLIADILNKMAGQKVLCLVKPDDGTELESSGRKILDDLGVEYRFVDLMHTVSAPLVLPEPVHSIFHLAAITNTGDPDHTINQIGTANLLRLLGTAVGAHTRFIFASTVSTIDNRRDMNAAAVESTDLLRPFHTYGRAKRDTEAILREQSEKLGFELVLFRFCAVFGANNNLKGFYGQFASMAKNGALLGRINFPGKVAIIYVNDLSDLLIRAAKMPMSKKVELLHPVAENLSIDEISQTFSDALGVKRKRIVVPSFVWQLARVGIRAFFKLEKVAPHFLYNKMWQLYLLTSNAYYCESEKVPELFPDFKPRKFADTCKELLVRLP